MTEVDDLEPTCKKLAGFLVKFREPDFTMLLEKCDSRVPGFSTKVTVEDLRYVKSTLTDQHSEDDVTKAIVGALKSSHFDRSEFEATINKSLSHGSEMHKEGRQADTRNSSSLPARSRSRISDYIILSEKLEANLMGRVNVLLKEGWEPIGGVGFAALGASPVGGNRFIQAMVKFAD